ncbi:MAG: hypothetical protein GC159_05665 [Phycisphaera sp.]|nr:hypothetical protein [Phycisphaera sp.]
MLKYRLIFGPLLLVTIALLFWLDSWLATVPLSGFWQDVFMGRPTPPPGIVLLALLTVIIILASRELATICKANDIHTRAWLIATCSIAGAVAVYSTPMSLSAPTGITIIATVLAISFVGTIIWHSKDAQIQGVVAAVGATMMAVTYLGVMGGFFLAIRRWHSAWVVLAIIFITKSGDIGAYFTGRAIGKHKLIPWLSPGKTWEGLGGAVVFSTLVALGFAWLSQQPWGVADTWRTQGDELVVAHRSYTLGWAAITGVLLALIGHAGDLTMSLFKRDAGLKDSSTLIPGMGGILDVIDSPMLIAPFAYWLLEAAAK